MGAPWAPTNTQTQTGGPHGTPEEGGLDRHSFLEGNEIYELQGPPP